MSTSLNAALGLAFLVLAFAATFTMFHFWGYPYDEENRKSSCPQWKMNIHRGIGFAYFAVYLALMIQMVPRLWTYQVEFPARTVAHICLGMGIGVILIVKISIIRFFRHLEEYMPVLGIVLLLFTVMLTGLSLPFVFKERALAASAEVFSEASVTRTRKQLEKAGLPEGTDLEKLVSEKGLLAGREVLLEDCVYCHDLKTAISKPRTPADWWRTVKRMGAKPTLGPKLDDEQQLHVTAYLVSITPELQDSAVVKRNEEMAKQKTVEAMRAEASAADAGPMGDGGAEGMPPPAPYDAAKAKATYEELCSQCHELSDVDDAPPKTAAEARALIARMADNGLEASPEQLKLVEQYLIETFTKK